MGFHLSQHCDESVSRSELVYTFFHPLLRDQEEASIHMRKLKGKIRLVPKYVYVLIQIVFLKLIRRQD